MMKKNYFILLILTMALAITAQAQQQQVFFTESFGEGADPAQLVTVYTGWHNPNITITAEGFSKIPDVRATTVSAAAIPPYPECSGSNNIFFQGGHAGSNESGIEINGINTSNFTDIQLSFGYRKLSAELTSDEFQVFYWNDTQWVEIPFVFNQAATDPVGWYRSPLLTLPADASKESLSLRFIRPITMNTEIRIDDLWLSGIPKIAAAVVSKAPIAINNTGFTAQWEALPYASGYLLDISELPTFTSGEPVVVAGWNNPIKYIVDSPIVADEYSTNNEGKTMLWTATGNAGNPVPYSGGDGSETGPWAVVSTGWEDGVYSKSFQAPIDARGFANLTLSAYLYSSGNGPKDMVFQYRTAPDAEWIDIENSKVTMPNAAYGATSTLTNVALPSACDNQKDLEVRWTACSSLRTSGAAAYIVTSGGTHRFAYFVVKGKEASFKEGYASVYVEGTSKEVSGLEEGKTYYYRVRATDGKNVSAASAIQEVRVKSGIEFTEANQALKAFYSPALNGFVIDGLDNEPAWLEVFDSNGRLLLEQSVEAATTVPANKLQKGMYLLSIKTKNGRVVSKCVK